MKDIRLIQGTVLFRGLPIETQNEIIDVAQTRKIEKGRTLFSIGEPADYLYIIIKGWVKLFRVSKAGEETIIHILGPRESFAEAAVFSENQSYPVSAQSIEDTEVYAVPRSFFHRKVKEDSQFALNMLGTIAARQHYLVQQMEQVSSRSAAQRVGAFLLRFCIDSETNIAGKEVTLPYDKAIISARLNIKPETFSRALSTLTEYGVHTKNRTVRITDPDCLADFCDFSFNERPCRK